ASSKSTRFPPRARRAASGPPPAPEPTTMTSYPEIVSRTLVSVASPSERHAETSAAHASSARRKGSIDAPRYTPTSSTCEATGSFQIGYGPTRVDVVRDAAPVETSLSRRQLLAGLFLIGMGCTSREDGGMND